MTPPNFFVVGAPKAGTTSLYHYLDQHPAIYMSPIKEPCFFAPEVTDLTPRAREIYTADAPALEAYLDGRIREKRESGFVLGWEQYLKLFENVRDETAIGEASVAYLGSMDAPLAIRARIPRARIVMMLRDPADRLFSHYTAAFTSGATSATFSRWTAEQLSAEATHRPPWGSVWAGRYSAQLRRYLQCFEEDQVRVHLYEDYARAPSAVLRDLFTFLGVDPEYPVETSWRYNVTLVPRWPVLHQGVLGPPVRALRAIVPASLATRVRGWYLTPQRSTPTAEERARAIEIYEDDIRTLATLIGRDLSGWLDPTPATARLAP